MGNLPNFRIVMTAGLVLLAGCGGAPENQAEPTAQDVFVAAEGLLNSAEPKEAAQMFNEVERLYPYSEWAQRAMIMAAYAHLQAHEYEAGRAAAERYLDFYPAASDAPYAQYLIALSYYDQIVDIGRDQSTTFQALQELRKVIERYPDSEYAASALLKFDLTLNHLAGKEMEIGRFYLKKAFYPAAINRFRAVVEEYQTTSHTAEALYRLMEAYLLLGLDEEAQTAAAILGHNFVGSDWYMDAFNVMMERGLRPEAAGQSWLTRIYRQVIRGEWL